GATQRYQIECPPALPAWLGSPLSLVALALPPVTLPELPLSAWALAKASFAGAGGGAWLQFNVTLPAAPLNPSTAIWQVVPATGAKLTRLRVLLPSMSS